MTSTPNRRLFRVTIRAFKSLEDVEIDLGRVNVFIGANGSGKSNLLEALGVLGAAANGRVDDEALLRRGVRPGVPALYKSSFRGSKISQTIHLEARSDHARYSVDLYNPINEPKPSWRYMAEALERDGVWLAGRSNRTQQKERLAADAGRASLEAVLLPEGDAAGELLATLRDFAIFAPDTDTLRGLRPDPQSREPIGLHGGRLAEAMDQLFAALGKDIPEASFRDALDLIDWASSFGVSSPGDVPISKSAPQITRLVRFTDRYMRESRNKLSGYDASEGALYVLFMMIVACHPSSPRVLAVDNFDHALNPRLAKALAKAVCEWSSRTGGRQLLLTSHNPSVLDGLPLLEDDDVRLFTVERSGKGKTIVQRVRVSQRLIAAAKRGVPLSQQWVMGTFGGVPNL